MGSGLVQKALKQAIRDDLVPRNVAANERPRSGRQRSKKEAEALSKEQVRALLVAASGKRNEALYIVAVHTGQRQGELLGLRWTDVNLGRGRGELAVRRLPMLGPVPHMVTPTISSVGHPGRRTFDTDTFVRGPR